MSHEHLTNLISPRSRNDNLTGSMQHEEMRLDRKWPSDLWYLNWGSLSTRRCDTGAFTRILLLRSWRISSMSRQLNESDSKQRTSLILRGRQRASECEKGSRGEGGIARPVMQMLEMSRSFYGTEGA